LIGLGLARALRAARAVLVIAIPVGLMGLSPVPARADAPLPCFKKGTTELVPTLHDAYGHPYCPGDPPPGGPPGKGGSQPPAPSPAAPTIGDTLAPAQDYLNGKASNAMSDLQGAANAGPGAAGAALDAATASAPQIAADLGTPLEAQEQDLINRLGQPDPSDKAPVAPPVVKDPAAQSPTPLTAGPMTAQPPTVDAQDQNLTGDRPLTYEDPFTGAVLTRQPGEAFARDSDGRLQSVPYKPFNDGISADADNCKTRSDFYVSPRCEAKRFRESLTDSAGCLAQHGNAVRNAHGYMVCRFKTMMIPLTPSSEPVQAPPPNTPLSPYFDPSVPAN